MKIIRRSFGERFALLELEDGDYYHLPLESVNIPSVSDELEFDIFGGDHPICSILHCGVVELYYQKTDAHTLKEL